MKKTTFKERIIHFAKTYTIFFVLIAVFLIFAIYKGKRFVNPVNLLNVVRQCAVVGIVCCGYSFVMISGGSDISTGWQMNLCMALMAKFMVDLGMNPVIAVLIGILGCIACQCLNQYIGLKLNLGGFMVTLATQNIFQGITYLYTDGRTVNNLPEGFKFITKTNVKYNIYSKKSTSERISVSAHSNKLYFKTFQSLADYDEVIYFYKELKELGILKKYIKVPILLIQHEAVLSLNRI